MRRPLTRRPAPREEQPPRLVLRFAILTALCLGLAAGGILLFTRHLNTVEAEKAAARHARFLAEAVLSEELRPADLASPVVGERRGELDRLFEHTVLIHGTLLVTLSRADRLITYSTDHELIGTSAADVGRTREALRGTITSEVTRIPGRSAGEDSVKVLQSYVPVAVGSGVSGVAAVYQDYGPIASAARAAFLPVAGILELVLLLLYLLLVPLLARVSRRIRRQMERIEHQAYHDDLTDLPNRLRFRQQVRSALETAERDGAEVAVLLLDVDRFKEVNDTLGHQSGDELLKAVGERLRNRLRDDTTLARLGGDEFGVVVTGGEEAAVAVGRRIEAALEEPFGLQGLPLLIEASVGVSLFPTHGEDPDTLIQRADVAVYVAKALHSGVAVYDPERDTNDPAQLALVGELRRAIDERELVLHYQPKVDARSGAVAGVEALIRWQHPQRGLLSPGAFVPTAERTGLIRPLSRYVLEGAVRQCRAWADAGLDLHVAVNLTMNDLLELDFPDQVAGLLERAGLAPGRLELEITESTIMADPFRVRHVLARLDEMGVRLAIDDFGTGYSSLGYLKNLPVHELKIDRSFVADMTTERNDAMIVRSTIDLARNLGLTVVAEGVEDEATWEALRELGCDLGQGWHFGKPMPAEELAALPAVRRVPGSPARPGHAAREDGASLVDIAVASFHRAAGARLSPRRARLDCEAPRAVSSAGRAGDS